MASEVFIDTSGFYAALVQRDESHDQAAQLVRGTSSRRQFMTTDYVLDETITLLKMRGVGHLVQRFLDVSLGSQACRIEWMYAERFDEARRFLLQHDDQNWSFTDCVSFCVMRQFDLRDALTKDQHFKAAGFVPLLA